MIKLKQILEWSKNDPIPEITRFDSGLGIILLGPPGIGKTTFSKEYILSRNNKFKIVNPDDVSYVFTKDKTGKRWRDNSANLAISYLSNIMKSKTNFIYDVTGTTIRRVTMVYNMAKDAGYTVILIHLLGELDTALKQNKQRERNVPEDILIQYYKKSQSLISKYSSELNPDNYYIILNLNNRYEFFKYENGKLLGRKVDKYVEKENYND